jgi:hypothetical protein
MAVRARLALAAAELVRCSRSMRAPWASARMHDVHLSTYPVGLSLLGRNSFSGFRFWQATHRRVGVLMLWSRSIRRLHALLRELRIHQI